MKKYVLLSAIFTAPAFGSSEIICSTAGELGEQNVFTIASATKASVADLNKKVGRHAKKGFQVSAPSQTVTSISTAKLTETTVTTCVTVSR